MRFKTDVILGLVICFFCIIMVVSKAVAGTPNVGYNHVHSSFSSDYGIKSFNYSVGYNSIQSVSGGQDVVNSHDYIAYKVNGIYSPEVGNGDVNLLELTLVHASNDNVYDSTTSFTSGSHRGFILPVPSLTFEMLKSDVSLYGTPSTTAYRIKVWTLFTLDDSWAPSLWVDDCSTTSF